MLRIIALVIFMSATISCVKSQEKFKVLIIHNLQGERSKFEIEKISTDCKSETKSKKGAILDVSMSRTPPHIIGKIPISECGNTDVLLSLDDKGGRLILKGVQSILNDTIDIPNWQILDNHLSDTFVRQTIYYRQINDSLIADPYKVKRKVEYSKKPIIVDSLNVVVNNHVYVISLDSMTLIDVQNGHGYKPNKKYIRYINLDKNTERKVRFTRIWYNTSWTRAVYTATLSIK